MSRPVPHRARQFTPTELEVRFARDAQLARKLNDAHPRFRRTNDRVWWGLHRDPLANVYGEHRIVELAFAEDRSEGLGAPDPLQALQQVRRVDCDFQHVAEDRRHLAADIGEVIRTFVDMLAAAGWSEAEAHNAAVHEITGVEGDMYGRVP